MTTLRSNSAGDSFGGGVTRLTDETSEQPKREFGNIHVISGTGPRVIKACHTCKYERRDGEERSDFWCEAAGASIDDTLENADWCGPDVNWWEPMPAKAAAAPTSACVPALVRFKRWLVG
jgi:hypothetical protein